jgi:signal transduction histidine kinase
LNSVVGESAVGTEVSTAVAGEALPSIRTRLARALGFWSLIWGLGVGAAVWLAASYEVDELLDDALHSSAELLSVLASRPDALAAGQTVVLGQASTAADRYAWQLLSSDGVLLLRSARAPAAPWQPKPVTGFTNVPDWRLYGQPVSTGRVLLVAQSRSERLEAQGVVALGTLLAALIVGLIGQFWLRARMTRELQPLQDLSQRLQAWDLDAEGALAPGALGPAHRQELLPVHQALQDIARRLAVRISNERAFSAHAAHALRTPLAGIDAQIALVLRDCPMPWQGRIQRTREAAQRMQGVVAALLGLFRSGLKAEPVDVMVDQLVQRLPVPRMQVVVQPGLNIRADADLLAAALLNLLDNAQRYGASQSWIECGGAGCLRIKDNGPGIPSEKLHHLQSAINNQAYDGATGLGLMLADRVARLHGGGLSLQAGQPGLVVMLCLSQAAPA